MSIEKTDLPEKIVYQSATVTITLWKDDTNLRYEYVTAWPIPGFANWEEYAVSLENDLNT